MKKIIALLIGTILSLHLGAMDQSAIQAPSDSSSASFNIEKFLTDLNCPTTRVDSVFIGATMPRRPTEERLSVIAEKLPQELTNQSQQIKDGVIEYAQKLSDFELRRTLITQAVLAGGNTNKYENGISRNPTLESLIQFDFEDYCYKSEALIKKNIQFAQFLLEHGANVNCYTLYNPCLEEELEATDARLIPIIFEARSVPLVTLMLEHGADLTLTSKEEVSKDIFQFNLKCSLPSNNYDPKLLEIYLKKLGTVSADALIPLTHEYFYSNFPDNTFENFSNYLKCLLDHGARLDTPINGKPLIKCILDTISEDSRLTLKHFIKEPTENVLPYLFTSEYLLYKYVFKFSQILFSYYHKHVMADHSCYLSKIPTDIKQMIIPFLAFTEWNSTIGIVQP